MKRILFLLTTLLNIAISTAQSESKTIDPRFIGCWEGTEVEQLEKGISNQWKTCRFANGSCVFSLVRIDEKDNVNEATYKGRWWVENDRFYEIIDKYKEPEVNEYEYEFVGESVRFTSTKISGYKNTYYTFMDHKID
ncbi:MULTISPECIES: hypothetical protein [Flavobacterium]|uniref:Lipocalin-like domain-containing protein n=2 Tax=Flavobacterium TaxID=237 RepID=A0AA94JRJ5_9FLAO|nr:MULTISPECIES: hypothetical protein [Flavobacterium]OXA75958.1 hypothetical protein B0A56_10715 [Flavobacterium columnare NBRC 100251 = ATCC 23463]AMA48268.1 hypothetical protein AWN65_01680 [Flavobacterium covae]AND63568.1 hypothetical protein AX766_03675 [Flavobacterium covae]MCH4830187.1 hypothetical protein [Flavobacterium columnare]MCH4832431.1 hypothetical protein [Flavobacterium columnare]